MRVPRLSQDLLKLRCPGPRCDRGRVSEKRRGEEGGDVGHPWARYRDHQPIGGQSATGASTFNNRYGVAHKPTTAPLVHSQRPSFWQPSRIISPGRTPCPAADHSRATSTEPHGSATTSAPPVAVRVPTRSRGAPEDVQQGHGRHRAVLEDLRAQVGARRQETKYGSITSRRA